MARAGNLMSDETRREVRKALNALRRAGLLANNVVLSIRADINECLANLGRANQENCRLGSIKTIVDRMTVSKHSYQGGAKVVIKFGFLQDDKGKVVGPKIFLKFLEPNARREVTPIVGRGGYKVDMVLSMKYKKEAADGNFEFGNIPHSSLGLPLYSMDGVGDLWKHLTMNVLSDVEYTTLNPESYHDTLQGSGWTILAVNGCTIRVYEGLNFGHGSGWVRLPTKFAKKKACINVEDQGDNKCFLHCMSKEQELWEKCHEKETFTRPGLIFVTSRMKVIMETYDVSTIRFSVTIGDVLKFEWRMRMFHP